MLPVISDGPRIIFTEPSEAYVWVHAWIELCFQSFQMGPVFFWKDLLKPMCGPSHVLIDAANNFGWAQYFFNETFQSLCVGPSMSKAKLLIVSDGPSNFWKNLPKPMYGPSCVLIDAANNFEWDQYLFNGTFQSLCVGPSISWIVLLIISDGPSICLTKPSEAYVWAHWQLPASNGIEWAHTKNIIMLHLSNIAASQKLPKTCIIYDSYAPLWYFWYWPIQCHWMQVTASGPTHKLWKVLSNKYWAHLK